MKFVNAIIYALYLIVYAYAVWMTSVKPEETYWGYLCTAIFGFLFTWTVSIVIKNSNKSENKEEKL
jgi:4-hydroxybenzoate polyprenyltransferase